MAIKFIYNNTTYTLLDQASRVTTPSLCHRKEGTTYYTPLLTSRRQTIGSYTYSAASPTVCCRYNNTTYYAAKSGSANYNIPAGTYTPSAFENLIRHYISANGSRKCANAFTAKVNGSTYNVSAGQAIKYCTTNTAGSSTNSTLRIVTFNGAKTAAGIDALPTSFRAFSGTYVVYASNFSGYCTFSEYAKYSITIGTGIKFS